MVRNAVLASMIEATDHDDVRQVFVWAIDDPDVQIRGTAARGIARFHPVEALPKIVVQLQSEVGAPSRGSSIRADLIVALASYGTLARPYVGLLETMAVNDPRNDERFIREMIDKINKSQ
jgi:hypothetical protein